MIDAPMGTVLRYLHRVVRKPADDAAPDGQLLERFRLAGDEAARQLGGTKCCVRVRLERGRQRLRSRMARRGLVLSAGVLVTALAPATAGVPAGLAAATTRAALLGTAGRAAAAGLVSAEVA